MSSVRRPPAGGMRWMARRDLLVSSKNYRPGPMEPQVQVVFWVRLRTPSVNAISITDCRPGLPPGGGDPSHAQESTRITRGESPT